MAESRTRDRARRASHLCALAVAWLSLHGVAWAEVTNPPAEAFRSSFEFGFDVEIEERDLTVRGSVATRSEKDELGSSVFRLGWKGEYAPIQRVWGKPRPYTRWGLRWTRVGTKTDLGDFVPQEPDATLQRALALEVSGGAARVLRNRRLREGIFATIEGDGETFAQIDYRDSVMPGYYAGTGFTFDTKVPGEEYPGWVAFSVGVEWTMRRYSLRGSATSFEPTAFADPVLPRPNNEAPLPPGTQFPAAYEVLQQFDTFSFWQHRLGPSFELEAGLRSRERFALSLFVATRLQFLVSRAIHTWGNPNGQTLTAYDRRQEPTATPIPLDASGRVVRFRSQSHALVVSVGGGIRFHWY